MLRNYAVSILRNLARNWLYSSISIIALTIGLCATLMTGLVIRNELSYDHFIPGYQRTYLAAAVLLPTGRVPLYDKRAPSWVSALLKLNFADVEAITRIADQDVRLQKGQIVSKETIYWTDGNLFDVLPLSILAGDARTALRRPDSIVLTRSAAKKYFGRDAPIGESILLGSVHPMTVTAVIEDLPVNGTQLETGIFASGLSSYSLLSQWDSSKNRPFTLRGRTYLRLRRNASMERLQKAMPAFVRANYPTLPPGLNASLRFILIDHVNLFPGLNPGISGRLTVLASVGVLILVLGCVVFVNLATARSSRRAVEVAIRKVSGASRGSLVLQFLSESMLYVLLAAALAAALTGLLTPRVNVFLDSGANFAWWRDPTLLAYVGLGAVTVGILGGAYPAFVLSAFRPASVLKGSMVHGGATARKYLVMLQFAALIGLLVAAAIVYQQRIYATRDALRVNTDQMMIIRTPCNTAFETELRSLPGVRGAFCSTESFLNGAAFSNLRLKDGTFVATDMVGAEFGVLDLYGLRPLAGRFGVARNSEPSLTTVGHYIINEAAARQFGFSSPAAAVGQVLPITESGAGSLPSVVSNEIIGVVPDFAINAVDQGTKPTIYYIPSPNYSDRGMRSYGLINVKLTGQAIPATLSAIDRLWSDTGNNAPSEHFFLNDYIQNLYLGMLREAQAFAVFSGIAVLLACLGLVGLAASVIERRTKEIGIRKAMGASRVDAMRLLIWQFAQPVLLANLIAWPVAGYLMHRWLQGFAYHVDLDPMIFVGAGAIALVIALATVAGHALIVASAKPVAALRYE